MICWSKRRHIPDEGWSWVMLFCTCVIMFLVFGVHYTFGILYPSLLKEFNQGEVKTAWVGSLSSGLLFLSSFAAIKSCELTSVVTTCLIGSFLSGFGLLMTSFIQNFSLLFFVYGFLFGIGSSFLYTPGFIMIARWFRKYQAVATGMSAASGALGAVILSPAVEHAIRLNGLRETLKAAGILYLSITVLCSLSYKPLCENDSTEMVRISDDGVLIEQDNLKSKNIFKLNTTLFKNKAFVLFLAVQVITNFTYYIPVIHLVHYATHLGIESHKSSLLISAWSVSSIIGRLTFGKIATHQRKHILRIYQICMVFSGIVTVLTYFATGYWMLVCYVISYGFLDGSFIGLLSLVTLEIVGLDNMAQGFGIMLTSIGVPIMIGPALVGMVNDAKMCPPQSMFLFSGIPFLIGAIVMIFLIRAKRNTVAYDNTDIIKVSPESNGLMSYVTAV